MVVESLGPFTELYNESDNDNEDMEEDIKSEEVSFFLRRSEFLFTIVQDS